MRRGGGNLKRQKKRKPKAVSASKKRDMQRIRDSVRGLVSNSEPFLGRIDPKRRQDAVDRFRAWAEMTGADLVKVLSKEANAPKKRGRKQDRLTPGRILLAGKLLGEGLTQGKMARQLFPGKEQEAAYGLTRSLFQKHKSAIDAATPQNKPTS
jgi:hypothetical protein